MFMNKRFFPFKYYVISTVAILFALFTGNNTGTHDKPSLSTVLHLVSTANAGESAEKKVRYWTCGMHPSVRMNKPGKCPICSMDLVPVYEKGVGMNEEGAVATVELGERARKLAQVKTDAVSFRSLTKEVYTVGLIEYDERLKSMVSAWIPGRIDKLFVDFTGTQVVKGESMVWIYSPDLVSTQEEYLLALETLDKVKESSFEEVINGAKSLVEASERRLLWWGVTAKQIAALTRNKKVKQHTIIYAPISGTVIEKKPMEGQYVQQGEMLYAIADLSNVWMKANIYEYEMASVKIGQEVEVTTSTYPGEAFIGKVSFIEPYLDDKTRSVKIRCDVPNQHHKLKPSMYANVRIRIPVDGLETEDNRYVSGLDYACPEHPEITSSRPGICPEDNIPFVKITPASNELMAANNADDQQETTAHGRTISSVPTNAVAYEYVCPMGCYRGNEPGNCPKCGMTLEKTPVPPYTALPEEEKVASASARTETVYVCPMGCYTSKADGDCPECGMHLEKKEIPVEAPGKTLVARKNAHPAMPAGSKEGMGKPLGEKLSCICSQEWDPATAPKTCPMCGTLIRKDTTAAATGGASQKVVYKCPMSCTTSGQPGECPDCKRQMGRWESKGDSGTKVKSLEMKKRIVYACPMHLEVVSDKPGNCPKCGMRLEKATQVLAIPATAVLDTGIRKIVYIEKSSGQYIGKEVALGSKAGDYYPVLEGLEEGDKVVTSANFLIDSQSQLTGGASALYGGAMEFKE